MNHLLVTYYRLYRIDLVVNSQTALDTTVCSFNDRCLFKARNDNSK